MHRHGHQARKFGRETDQRRALVANLANSLVLNESIETTLPKAKETVRYTERLITKAKKGDLHARRQIIAKLTTLEAVHKLMDDVAPNLTSRNSGYFRIVRTTVRRGDGAQLARISFVDDIKTKSAPKKTPAKPSSKAKTPARKPVARRAIKKEVKK